jgi:hypothetical protein
VVLGVAFKTGLWVAVQCCSSEKSPQSFSPSHIQVWGMHCPFAHSNWWVLQASPLTKLAPNPSCKTRNVKSSRGRHWCHLKWRTILDIIGGWLLLQGLIKYTLLKLGLPLKLTQPFCTFFWKRKNNN